MEESTDLSTLDLKTIMSYAEKYLKLAKENNKRQKKYYGKASKKNVIRKKAQRNYYIKKDLYHPEYNPDCMNEGKKYKRPKEEKDESQNSIVELQN
jgi:hypothetical protein